MSECEICGKEGAGYLIFTEGAKMRVCADCSKFGKVLQEPRSEASGGGMRQVHERGVPMIEIVEDYAERIVKAREKMRIERKVLAEMINEMDSFLERVEHGKTLPDERLARKLEKALGIKLIETDADEKYVPVVHGERKGLTLGDVVNVKKKNEKTE